MQTIVNRDWPQVPSTPKISGVERLVRDSYLTIQL
jgi:hypothetical protein